MIQYWRNDLNKVLVYYKRKRNEYNYFFLHLFLFFLILNAVCYWLAMLTAFPELTRGNTFWYYFKVQFPVSIMGAFFDSFSFFVTIYIIKQALNSSNNLIYVVHLSIDFLIAVLATFWILLVFIVSGWIVSFFEILYAPAIIIEHYDHDTNIYNRVEGYSSKVNDAIQNPTRNIKNIYFGMVMGLSAMLPTLMHITLFFRSIIRLNVMTN